MQGGAQFVIFGTASYLQKIFVLQFDKVYCKIPLVVQIFFVFGDL